MPIDFPAHYQNFFILFKWFICAKIKRSTAVGHYQIINVVFPHAVNISRTVL